MDDACTTLEVGDGAGPAIEPENQILSLTFIRSQHESKSDSIAIYVGYFSLEIVHSILTRYTNKRHFQHIFKVICQRTRVIQRGNQMLRECEYTEW